MIKGIEHVALSVSDLDRSIAFYTDVIGFKLARLIECTPQMRLEDVAGLPGCKARIAHLESGKLMLELFEYQQPRGREIRENHTQADLGFSHIGFKSTDVRGEYQRLKKIGIRFFSAPVEFRPGIWLCYFYGPDGEVCELREQGGEGV
ncbi:MAG: VOC family protein [Spirochaetota bacterium]